MWVQRVRGVVWRSAAVALVGLGALGSAPALAVPGWFASHKTVDQQALIDYAYMRSCRPTIPYGGEAAQKAAGLAARMNVLTASDGQMAVDLGNQEFGALVGAGLMPNAHTLAPLLWPDGTTFSHIVSVSSTPCSLSGILRSAPGTNSGRPGGGDWNGVAWHDAGFVFYGQAVVQQGSYTYESPQWWTDAPAGCTSAAFTPGGGARIASHLATGNNCNVWDGQQFVLLPLFISYAYLLESDLKLDAPMHGTISGSYPVGGTPPSGSALDAIIAAFDAGSVDFESSSDYGVGVPGAKDPLTGKSYFPPGPDAPETWGSGKGGPGSPFSPYPPDCKKADPVSCATGNFTETQEDFAVGGLGLGLQAARTYNAQAAAQTSSAGPFGYGWAARFFEHLTVGPSLPVPSVSVTAADGSVATLYPNGDGTYRQAPWVQARLVHNGDGTWSYTLADQRVMSFDASGRLTSERDSNGNLTTLTYDGSGRLTTVTDPTARQLTFTYNPDGTVATARSPRGRQASYGYDGSGNLTSVTNVAGGVWHFGYDARHRMTTMQDPRSNTTTNVYDAQDRVTSQTDRMNRVTLFDYSTPGKTLVTDPAGHVTEMTFSSNLPTSIITAKGTSDQSTKTIAYDGKANPTTVTDGRGHDWTYTYDAAGNRLSASDPLGHTTSWTYDAHRNVLTETKPSGLLTTFGYDTHDNLTSVTRTVTETSSQQQTIYTYNALGQLTKKTDPLTHFWAYTYDANGNRSSQTSPLGNKTTYVYDLDGMLTSSVAPRGNVTGGTPASYTTSYIRNAFGDPTTITDRRGKTTVLAYDANRNKTDVTDRDLRHSLTTFNADDEPTQVTRPDGSIVKTAYTPTGQVASQTDGLNRVTAYGYDAQDRVQSITDPNNRATSFAYDPASNRTSTTDPSSRSTTFTYDNANRLTGVHYSTGSPADLSFTYTADGLRKTTVDESGTTTWNYDSVNRLASAVNGQGQTTSYTYDLADRQTKITYPPALVPGPAGTTPSTVATGAVTRTFDNDDRMLTVKDWLNHTTTFAYNQDDAISSITRPDGTKSTNTLDANDAMTKISDTKSGGFSWVATYTRSNAELLKTQAETGASAQPNPTYTYDTLARLKSTGATAGQTYSYDNADNPTQIVRGSVTANQTFDPANQLTAITNASGLNTASLGYSPLGERTTLTPTTGLATSYAYDQASQLRTYTGPDTSGAALTQTYGYDATGTRTYTQAAGTRTYETWDTSGDLPLMIEDGSTAYIYGPEGIPIEQVLSGGTVRYLHHDQLGSIRAITDQTAATIATYNYDPYGKPLASTGTSTNPFRYAGQYTDPTGLQYLRARYYEPATAQFLTRDPVVQQTRSAYGYADGSPVNATDPQGTNPALLACAVTVEIPFVGEATCGAAIVVTTIDVAVVAGGVIVAARDKSHSADRSTSPEESAGDPTCQPLGRPGPDFEWRGGNKGAWYNPKTGEYWRPDPSHGPPQGPHWDYRDPAGGRWRVYPDGRVEPK